MHATGTTAVHLEPRLNLGRFVVAGNGLRLASREGRVSPAWSHHMPGHTEGNKER